MLHHTEAAGPLARVVLLGGGGFIGRALADRLAAAGVVVDAPGSRDLDLEADGADVALANRLRPEDSVVVLAALTPDRGRGYDTFLRNLTMGANIGRALERRPVAHVVYVSSDAVYPMTASLVNEETPPVADDLYGAMHRAREVMLRTAVKGPLAVLRPTLVYGGGDPHNSYGPNRLRRAARDQKRITLFGAGEETRDHIALADVVDLIRLVLEGRGDGVLNLATGRSVDFDTLARLVAAAAADTVTIEHTPRQTPITHRHFDVAALRRSFPAFRFTPLEIGLAQAADAEPSLAKGQA